MNNIDFKTLKVGNYNRKSSESEDRQMLSIESQKDEARRIADFYNLPSFVETFVESKSAKKEFARPEFGKMLAMVEKGTIDTIVCWKPDRLARNMTEGGKLIDLLSSGILKAIITHDKVYYPWDNVIVLAVEFGQGKQFIKDLSASVKRGQLKKATMGIPHGVASLGFLNDKVEEKGNRRWLVNSEALEKIKILFKTFLLGEISASKLYDYAVNELKLTTVKRKRIGGNLIQPSRIYEILKDPVYAGFFFYGKERHELDKKLPRLITEDEHNRVKMLLGKRNIPKTQKHESTFSGFMSSPIGEYMGADFKHQLICECNYKFAHRDKTHCPKCNISIDKMEKIKYLDYTYYYNVTKKKRKEKVRTVSDATVEDYILSTFSNVFEFSPDLVQWSRKHIKEIRDNEVNENLIKEETTLKNAEDFVNQKRKRREMFANGLMNQDEYKADLIDLEARYKPLEASTRADWTIKANEIVDLSQEFVSIMRNGEVKAKRKVLNKLGSNLIWNEEKLSIINAKSIQALINGINKIKSEYPGFEPKKYVANKGSKEKTEPENSINSIMLLR